MFLALKFGLCFLKSSSLVSLTKEESWFNTSRWLAVSTLYRGITSHHLEPRGPITFAWGVAPPEGEACTGSGEGCSSLALGVSLGAGREGAMGAGASSEEEGHCVGLRGRDISNCPINTW